MFLDHLGAFLFPGVLWLRLVGRIAMPLFAFTLAEGCFFTRSKSRHLALIGGMGLVTSTVASIATGEVQGDILITFALSCLVIGGLDALKQACFSGRARAGCIALSAAALAAVLGGAVWLCFCSGIRIEYGLTGVLLAVTVHLFDFRACGERGEALSAVLYHPVSAILLFAAGLIVRRAGRSGSPLRRSCPSRSTAASAAAGSSNISSTCFIPRILRSSAALRSFFYECCVFLRGTS